MTVPTLYNFTEALQAPDLAFSTLRDCHPRRTATGGVALSRTSRFAEAEIEWQSRKYLLCFPLSTASIFAVEQTAARLRYLRTPLLTEYTILRDEMTYTDDTGTTRTCDGFFYRKKDVAVVGGGDTACEEATYLASICRQVYLIVRKPYLRASKAMQERVMNTPNIKVLFEHNTAEVLGDETGVTGALLRDNKGTETKIDIAGFFVAIGHHPNTEIFADQLELDAEGYIKTVAGSSRTSVEGVFAAGDVQDPHYRQAITAAGSGCMAALDCERFLLQ